MRTKTGILALIALLGATGFCHALAITPSSGVLNSTRWEGNENGQAAIDTVLDGIVTDITDHELYKANVGDEDNPATVEEGPLAPNYATTFANPPLDPAEATITHTGGAFVGPTAYLLVKGGAPPTVSPHWYFYNLTALGWNGTETLELSGFWPNQGAISHVTLYGGRGTSVPDGGSSVALLGAVLLGFAPLRRFLARRS